MKKSLLFTKAIKLRKSGNSFKTIGNKLNISYSTSYAWLKNVELCDFAKQRISESQCRGREKGHKAIVNKRLEREYELFKNVQTLFDRVENSHDLLKIYCSLLYWGEGSKGRGGVVFMNSDPLMVKLFIQLLTMGFNIDKTRLKAYLHLHKYHNRDQQMQFWSGLTGIPKDRISVYNKRNSAKNIRANYPGCISIRYYDTALLNEIKFIYQLLAKNLGA